MYSGAWMSYKATSTPLILSSSPWETAVRERVSAYRVSAASGVRSRERNVTFVRYGYAFPNGTFEKYAAA